MSIRRVTSPEVAEATPGLRSNCLVVDRIAYVSGMTARDRNFQPAKDADEYVQAKIIFGKIRALVEAAGGAMADIVKLTIFVTNIANREKVCAARREFFTGDFPCASLVEVFALASPEILVEIEAIAHLGASTES
jgi:enamine deaminase RidA (YjgF/YER057c/UK114 family)